MCTVGHIDFFHLEQAGTEKETIASQPVSDVSTGIFQLDYSADCDAVCRRRKLYTILFVGLSDAAGRSIVCTDLFMHCHHVC